MDDKSMNKRTWLARVIGGLFAIPLLAQKADVQPAPVADGKAAVDYTKSQAQVTAAAGTDPANLNCIETGPKQIQCTTKGATRTPPDDNSASIGWKSGAARAGECPVCGTLHTPAVITAKENCYSPDHTVSASCAAKLIYCVRCYNVFAYFG